MIKTIKNKIAYIKDNILDNPSETDIEVLRAVIETLNKEPEHILAKLNISGLLELYIKKLDKYDY